MYILPNPKVKSTKKGTLYKSAVRFAETQIKLGAKGNIGNPVQSHNLAGVAVGTVVVDMMSTIKRTKGSSIIPCLRLVYNSAHR